VCAISYARIQGKASMISRFQNSSLMEKDGEYRPLLFVSSGPDKGRPEPFPVGSKQRRNSMPNGAMQPGVGAMQQQGTAMPMQGTAMPMQQGAVMPSMNGGAMSSAMNSGAMGSAVPAAAVCANSGVQQQQQQQQGRDSRCVSAVSTASIMN
jgi:hypothetical protein